MTRMLLIAAVLLGASARLDARQPDRPPSFIYIMADDLGYGELGCYGQTKIRTPRLDRMAAEGMRFSQFYAAAPVCAPTRCSLITGLHTGHSFIRDNREIQPEGQLALPEGTVTLPLLLRRAGYTTAMTGKWGLGAPGSSGEPNRQGFDFFFGYLCQRQAHNFYPTHLWRNADKVILEGNTPRNIVGRHYAHDLMVDEALRFIRENHDRAFFLYVPFTIPHVAIQVPEDSLAEYLGAFPEEPYDGSQGYLPHPTPHAGYAAMVTRMDRDVGRMLDLVDSLGIASSTYVFFTSDNGPTHGRVGGADSDFFESSGPFRGRKGSVYEGGVRVPFIARCPGAVPAGTVTEHVAASFDAMPTLLDLAGAPVPEGLDGLSFAPTLHGRAGQQTHDAIYWGFPGYGGQQAVRFGDYKAVRRDLHRTPDAPLELYDLAVDPAESRNIASERPDLVARARALMAAAHRPSPEFPFRALDP